MFYCFFKSVFTLRRVGYLFVLSMLCVSGCGDFFDRKPIELETQVLLNELGQIKENTAVKNPMPELYRRLPERISVKDGVKLFYFTRQHTVKKLSGLIKEQLGYKVSLNSATNQLIIHCPSDNDVDKTLEFLEKVDVPPIQVNIDCIVLERFADVTMDWETKIQIENLLGEEITLGGKKGWDPLSEEWKLLPAFPGASLREPKRAEFGLDVGYWGNKGILGHEFRAVVDMLISRGYLKVLMNPTLETVNGQKARVMARDFAPIQKLVSTATSVTPYNLTDYQWVEDALEVTPNVFADGSIGLKTKITMGSKSKPEGVTQASVITERTIEVTENRIEPGSSLVIGGIRKTESRGVIRGVPFFKDLPLIGVLFSSKDVEEKAVEIIFILTPSISSGGIEYAEMIEDVRKKQQEPESESKWEDIFADPFGFGAYTEHVEQRAAEAEFERFKVELEKAEAQGEVDQVKQELLKIAEDILAEKQKAAKAKAALRKMKSQADKAKAEAKKAKADATKAKAEAEKAKSDANKAKAEAEKAKEEADKCNLEIEEQGNQE